MKLVSLFPRIVQKVRDDVVEAFGFPADDVHELFLIIFQRNQTSQLLYRASHCRQRLPDFVSDRRRKPSKRSHAFFRGHFLLEPAQIREVLEVEYKAAALFGSQT